jgi:type II secretory pathway component PulJ
MNKDLRQVFDVMQRDLARAGGWNVAGNVALSGSLHDLSASATSGSIELQSRLAGTSTVASAFVAPLSGAVLENRTLLIVAREAGGATRRHALRIDRQVSASTLAVTIASGDTLPSTRVAAGSWTVLSPFTDIVVSGSDCLVFAYDENGNGQRDAQERFGYRYNASDRAVRAVNNADSCGSGDWENISDERALRVTALSFATVIAATAGGNALQGQRRFAAFAINARLRNVASADRALQASALLRNDAVR